MRTRTVVVVAAAMLIVSAPLLTASGPVGIYGIVEKVVFEPDEAGTERVQVWGAFAYVETGAGSEPQTSAPVRGYLYFALPSAASGFGGPDAVRTIRREWADLKAIAGTGQAVAFGRWGYIGWFAALDPRAQSDTIPYIYARAPQGGTFTDLRVRPASEAPAAPATYQTNAGVVRLTDRGSHAAVVGMLRGALGK